jgi:hypothetical protein
MGRRRIHADVAAKSRAYRSRVAEERGGQAEAIAVPRRCYRTAAGQPCCGHPRARRPEGATGRPAPCPCVAPRAASTHRMGAQDRADAEGLRLVIKPEKLHPAKRQRRRRVPS